MGFLSRIGLAPKSEVESLREEIRALQSRELKRAQASGVPITFGQFEYERNAALSGSKKWDVYEDMENDPEVKAALTRIKSALTNARWEFTAASDSSKDQEIAELCNANLLCQTSDRFGREYWCETSWEAQRLPEILDMLNSGFAMFAKSMRNQPGPGGLRRIYDRIQWLEPRSVDPMGWELDRADQILSVKRTFKDATGRYTVRDPLKSDAIALYVWDLKGARYQGRPLIRSMYGAWLRKDFVLRQSVIWAQKTGAPMPYGFYPPSYSTDDIERFVEAVESMRGSSPAHAFFAGPKGSDGTDPTLGYAGADAGEVDRMRGLVDGENREIARGIRSSMQLGQSETGSGSRAVGQVQQSDEMLMIQSCASSVIGFEMRGVANLRGLVQDLVDENYAGVREYPHLTVSKIRPDEDMVLEARRISAWKEGVLPKAPEVRREISEGLGFNLPEDVYEVEEPLPMAGPMEPEDDAEEDRTEKSESAQDAPGSTNEAEDVSEAGPVQKTVPEASQRVEAGLAEDVSRIKSLPEGSNAIPPQADGGRGAKPRGWFRAPTLFEVEFVNLAEIDRTLTVFEQRYYAVASSVLRKAEADVVERIKSGRINTRNYPTLRAGLDGPSVKYTAALKSGIASVLRRTGAFGAEQVRAELSRQVHSSRLAMATRGKVTITSELYETRASIDAGWLIDRLTSEIIAEFDRLMREGLGQKEIALRMEAFLGQLSDKPIGELARKATTTAFNVGRGLEIQRREDQVAFVIRTEILDGNTCKVCAGLDGKKYDVGSDEYFANMPPNKCEGGDRCRGFYLAVGEVA